MQNVKQLINDVLTKGKHKEDRTGVGRISLFGPQLSFDLTQGFPALTLKKLPFKTMVVETLWFLRGEETCEYLDEYNCKIWKEWAHPTLNSVGPMYGKQLRHYPSIRGEIDQFKLAIEKFKQRPFASDNVITLWNPATVPDYYDKKGNKRTAEINVEEGMQALANCHGTVFQLFGEPLTVEEALNAMDTYHLLRIYKRLSYDMRGSLKAHMRKTEGYWSDADYQYALDIKCDIDLTISSIITDIEEGNEVTQYRENMINDILKLMPGGKWYFYSNSLCNPHDLKDDPDYTQATEEEVKANIIKVLKIPTVGLRTKMYQRSQDLITAIGFNVSQYALLTHIIAKLTNSIPLEYIQTWGDVHIYSNHVEAAKEMLTREPYPAPTLSIDKSLELSDFDTDDFQVEPNDFSLIGYQSHPTIKTDIAV
jgi:thymidylate synthase